MSGEFAKFGVLLGGKNSSGVFGQEGVDPQSDCKIASSDVVPFLEQSAEAYSILKEIESLTSILLLNATIETARKESCDARSKVDTADQLASFARTLEASLMSLTDTYERLTAISMEEPAKDTKRNLQNLSVVPGGRKK